MLRIVLVDDEALIRSFMRTLIAESPAGHQVVGEAASAEQALSLLAGTEADVLLVDVRMPGMGGVALVRLAKERWPHVRCVMLSGHDDFAYVRDSMALGAVDYLLKYRLDLASFDRAMATVEDQLEQAYREEARTRQLAQTADRAAPLLKEQFLASALRGEAEEEDPVWAGLLENYDGPAALAVFALDYLSSKRLERMPDRARRVMASALGEGCILCPTEEGILAALLPAREAAERTKQALRSMTLLLNLQARTALSEAASFARELPERYAQALERLRRSEEAKGLGAEQAERLLGAINSASRDALKREMREIFGCAALEKPSGERLDAPQPVSRKLVADVLAVIRLAAGQSQLDVDELLRDQLQMLERETGQDAAALVLGGMLLRVQEALTESGHSALRSEHVRNAVAYIDAHFHQPLTLEGVAAQINVSAPYVSRQFRSELGVTFTTYVNRVRIAAACRYLRHGIPAQEAAERSGYPNLSYFFRTFKEICGCTPSAYVKQCKSVQDSNKPVH